MDKLVVDSSHSDVFTCTLDDTFNCTMRDSGFVHDQSIVPPTSSSEENVNFTDDVEFA